MLNLSMVEFYLAKIESYMRRKHESLLNDAASTNDSKSTIDPEDALNDDQVKALGDVPDEEIKEEPEPDRMKE